MFDNFTGLKSSPQVLNALERAASRRPTSAELLEQRVSFVFGTIDRDNGVTRERVRELLLEQQGVAAEAGK